MPWRGCATDCESKLMEEPDELMALENELQQLLAAAPSPVLRERVARRVADELRRMRRRDWLGYAAAVAAMLVLWANLSWSVSRATTHNWRAGESAPISADVIEQLVPGISRREALRQAIVLTGGRARFVPASELKRATPPDHVN
jgi:hypothetical protein